MTFSRRTALGVAASLPFVWRSKAQSRGPIKIGLIAPLSGSQQDIGNHLKVGAELGVAHVNADGGINGRMLELVERDAKADAPTAIAAARELAAQGINLTLGTVNSALALALGPVMQQLGSIHLAGGAGSDKINHGAYNPNFVRVGAEPYMFVRAETKLIAEKYPALRRWVGLVPDHEYGRTVWSTFVDGMLTFYPAATGAKPDIVDPVMTPFGGGDFKTQINTAMRLAPDGLLNCNYGSDLITILQQARPYGLLTKAKLFVDSAGDLLVAEAMRKQVPSYWTSSLWYPGAHTDNPISVRLYKDAVPLSHEGIPMGWVGENHAGVLAYAAAIRKAGGATDTPSVLQALKGLQWDTATGPRIIRGEDNQAICNVDLIYITSDSNERGYRVAETRVIPGADVIEPPTPGKPLVYKTL